ncbi:D-hexose-6-phosphate mutarotase [Vitiosangium sp. GDMCC 1.1324]|uniref:D-hexose-6-phosphate mutarotase n=1 Tax=Vitiosangium sp. (strain GDMCC 1.1324) TaxID=2138576 RepID=UPI000D3DA3F1|nr:D-hexose-6-phosphate mutarotase [Vitiosangium sp. GDMCC 1.1324]PTL84530.1 D-hexose-6-phosphate mutarotase [Vitiosangium sp. GDMCC 1.1324]
MHPNADASTDSLSTVTATDGARIRFSTHGGQICSWTTADGIERLYLSPRADLQGPAAIRGGVPVIFPQFANEGPLPKHGFARSSLWRVSSSETLPCGSGSVEMRLSDDAATRQVWPHPFELVLRARFKGMELDLSLAVINTGSAPFDFTCALHTYLAANATEAVIHGLQGLHYLDSADHRRMGVQQEELLRIDREVDRFFFGLTGPVELRGGATSIRVKQEAFADVVVWNPWSELARKLADLPDDGFRHFVCIESGTVQRPVSLAPGKEWLASQHLRVG